MASQVIFAFAVLGLCLASSNGVQGRIFTAEDGVKMRPYIIPKALNGANATYASPQSDAGLIKHHVLYETTRQSEYYGTKAAINVYGFPNLKKTQISASGIWIFNGESDQINVIQTGWHVSPGLYGDTQTRFYTFWTADNYRHTGCFNHLCNGFVTTNATLVPGDVIKPLSTIGGDQYSLNLKVYKELQTGDWWLILEDDENGDIKIGYWPKSIFTSLADNASVMQWGGYVVYPSGEERPPMGNGQYYLDGGYGFCAYISNIKFVSPENVEHDPDDSTQKRYIDYPDCYDADALDKEMGAYSFLEYAMFYGGPKCKS